MKTQLFTALCVIGVVLAKPPRLHKRDIIPSPRDPNYSLGSLYTNPFARPASSPLTYRGLGALNTLLSPSLVNLGLLGQAPISAPLTALPTAATTLTSTSDVTSDDATAQITADQLTAVVQLPETYPSGLGNIDLAGLLRSNPNLNPGLLGLPNGILASQLQGLPNLASGSGLLGHLQPALLAALKASLPLADGQLPLGLALPSGIGNSDLTGLLRNNIPEALTLNPNLSPGILGLSQSRLPNGLLASQLPNSDPTGSGLLGLLLPDLLAAVNASPPVADGQLPLGLGGLANPLALQLAGGLQPSQLAVLPASTLNSDPRLLGRPQFFLIGTAVGRLPLPHVHITNTFAVPVRVPQPYNVVRNVPVGVRQNVPYAVDKPYPVGVPRPYPVAVDRPYQVSVDRPYGVPVPHQVPVPVDRPVGVPVPHPIPVEIRRPYAVPYRVPVPVNVPAPQTVQVVQPVEVEVPTPQPITVEVPVQRQQVAVEISQPYAVQYASVAPQARTPVVIPYTLERQAVQEIRHQVINHGTPQEVRQELTVPRAVVQVSTLRPVLAEVRTEVTNHGTPRPFSVAHLVTPQPTVLHDVRHEVTHHGTPKAVLQEVRHEVTHHGTPRTLLQQEVRHEVTHHGTPRTVLQQIHPATHIVTPQPAVLQEVRHEETHHGTPRTVLQQIHPATHIVTPQPAVLQEVHHEVTHHGTPRTLLQQEVRHEVTHHGTPRTVFQQIHYPNAQIVTPEPTLQQVRHQVTHHVTQRPIVVADDDQNGGADEEVEEYDEDNEADDEGKRRIRRN